MSPTKDDAHITYVTDRQTEKCEIVVFYYVYMYCMYVCIFVLLNKLRLELRRCIK